MRQDVLFVATMCMLLTVSQVSAKEKKHDKKMDPQEMMEVWKKLGTPGEPHKLFASIAGSYMTHTKEWMEPGKPPMESDGTSESKMLLDGRFLYQEYKAQMMGQPFSGIGIDGYDNLTKKYVTVWIDSMGTGIFFMEGTASPDGKTITLRGSHPEQGGSKLSHRAVWRIVDNNQTFEMYGAHGREKEMKFLEIIYTRKP
jgi:hypothetical protein